ncbi:MAG TPA: hypothetical protein VMG98_12025 [Verrucomicrobiae bacterium]|nr:hypothetical protein [Verrucomicrobiae bacterium]
MAEHAAVDRFVDFASLTLISVAAVLSAVCGYQAGRWDGEQSRLYSLANANRVIGAETVGEDDARTTINVAIFLKYIDALSTGNAQESKFLYRRFPPHMRAVLDAWLATKPLKNPKAPLSPFAMPQYAQQMQATERRYDQAASGDFDAAQVAHRHADDFSLLTIIFAAVSFLAGISTKMVFPRHAIIVGLGIIALIYGVVRLIGIPVL